ncbi:hypothetical protein TNIN_499321, partial [Trichonephila inaurata madagascariensis]
AANVGKNKPETGKASTAQQTRVNEINLNPDKYFEKNPRNSASISTSNRVYVVPKQEDDDCAGQRDAKVILETDSELDARNEVPSPNSSNTCSTNTEVSVDFQCSSCKGVFLEFEDYVYHQLGFCGKCI